MTTELVPLIQAIAIGLLGIGLGALTGWLVNPRWVAGLTGGITGGFGIAALNLAGLGDVGLLPMAGVLVVYGALVGVASLMTQRARKRE